MKIPEDMLRAASEVNDELRSRPGVTGVDVGLKEVNGKLTNQFAIRIYVAEKKTDLPAGQVLPSEINGHRTDVLEATFEVQGDWTRYDPLVGGCAVELCGNPS